MKLLVAIPSKGRSKSIFDRTMRWVSRTGYDVRVFCEPAEIEEYREGAREANYKHTLDISDDNFVSTGKDNIGLSGQKAFIKQYAEKHGYDLVFKMDDDILRFKGRGRNVPDDKMIIYFSDMVGRCRVTFGKYPDVAAIGFPYDGEMFTGKVKQWQAINARLQTAYIIRTEYLQSGFNTFEDFAQFIYIRSKNKTVLRYGLMGIDCADVGKGKGGLQDMDRNAMSAKEAEALRKIYPALKFKSVDNKQWAFEPIISGDFFDTRWL